MLKIPSLTEVLTDMLNKNIFGIRQMQTFGVLASENGKVQTFAEYSLKNADICRIWIYTGSLKRAVSSSLFSIKAFVAQSISVARERSDQSIMAVYF